MKLGDLVHVQADNFYFGVGLIINVDDFGYFVLTSDGKSFWYFGEELTLVDESDETG